MNKILVLFLGVATACVANASSITFAGVTYLGGSGSNVTYEWRNEGSGFLGLQTDLGAAPAAIPVAFTYQNMASIPVALQGTLNAHMTINAPAMGNAVNGGAALGISQTLGGSIVITLDTPYLGQSNLLTATFTGALSGKSNSATANMNADTAVGDTVIFTSDFLSFAGDIQDSLSFTFNSVTPQLAQIPAGCADFVPCGYLRTFRSSGSGLFAADTSPDLLTPEPSSFVLGGLGLALSMIGLFRKRAKA